MDRMRLSELLTLPAAFEAFLAFCAAEFSSVSVLVVCVCDVFLFACIARVGWPATNAVLCRRMRCFTIVFASTRVWPPLFSRYARCCVDCAVILVGRLLLRFAFLFCRHWRFVRMTWFLQGNGTIQELLAEANAIWVRSLLLCCADDRVLFRRCI